MENAKFRNAIFTGISNLDILLENGIFEGDIIEICGKPDTGKTILATTIATNLSQNQKLGTVFLDLNNGFEGTRVYKILMERGCPEKDIPEIMERIIVEKVLSLNELLDVLEELPSFLKTNFHIKTLILDSFAALWFSNLFNFERTMKKITKIVCILRKLAKEFKLIIIITNIFIAEFKENDCKVSSTKMRPAMGKYWLTVPNTRLGVEKTGLQMKVSIEKSNLYSKDDYCYLQFVQSSIQ